MDDIWFDMDRTLLRDSVRRGYDTDEQDEERVEVELADVECESCQLFCPMLCSILDFLASPSPMNHATDIQVAKDDRRGGEVAFEEHFDGTPPPSSSASSLPDPSLRLNGQTARWGSYESLSPTGSTEDSEEGSDSDASSIEWTVNAPGV